LGDAGAHWEVADCADADADLKPGYEYAGPAADRHPQESAYGDPTCTDSGATDLDADRCPADCDPSGCDGHDDC